MREYKILSGKTLQDFERWLKNDFEANDFEKFVINDCINFWDLHISLKIGVLILYFDSVGVELERLIHYRIVMELEIEKAWTQAVEKALEIREEQLNK